MRFSVSRGILSLPNFPLQSEEQILRKYNLQRLIKMASNENCYGASQMAIDAVAGASSEFHRYPEVYGAPLKRKLSGMLDLDPSQIVLGNGSTELVEMIAKTFLQPQEKCLTAYETFPIYRLAAHTVNAICETVRLRDYDYDLDGLLAAIGPDTRLIFIANPNNPTGRALKQENLKSFLERVPANVLVVVDEAYREYAPELVDSVGDITEHSNLIVLRTFSKVYGLAGLRIGYASCSKEVASHLNRVALPYGINSLAQSAAIAALDDQAHVKECAAKNFEQRERLQMGFYARGFESVSSVANFILLKVPDPPSLYEKLLQRGILIALVDHFHIRDGVRITVGTAEENSILLDAL